MLEQIKKMIFARYRNKRILTGVSVFAFLVLCLSFYFIFLSSLKQSQMLSRITKEKEADLNRAKALASEFNRLNLQITKTQDKLSKIKKNLFWERDISKFLHEITQLAADLKIDFSSLRPEPEFLLPQKTELKLGYRLIEIPITVMLKTDFSELIRFLKRIEERDKFISIDTLAVSQDPTDIYRHNVRLRLVIFVEEKI